MTRDELIRMAVQCQLVTACNRDGVYMDALAKFADLIALAERKRTWIPVDWLDYEKNIAAMEREACALICDSHADDPVYCGEAIRARGD